MFSAASVKFDCKFIYNVHSLLLLVVHGGIGEDGTLQSLLDAEGVLYTGSWINDNLPLIHETIIMLSTTGVRFFKKIVIVFSPSFIFH